MDHLELPGYARSTPTRSNSNPGQRPTTNRKDHPPQMTALRGIIRRLKPPVKHYSKQFTVRPYYATEAEDASAPNRGVTFSPDTKNSLENLQTSDFAIPIDELVFGMETGKHSRSPSPKGSIASGGPRRLSLNVDPIATTDQVAIDDSWLRHNSLPNVKECTETVDQTTHMQRSVSGIMEPNEDDELLMEAPVDEDSEGAVTIRDPEALLQQIEDADNSRQPKEPPAEEEVLCFASHRL